MTQQDIIQTILKDSNQRLNLFTPHVINDLRNIICIKPFFIVLY